MDDSTWNSIGRSATGYNAPFKENQMLSKKTEPVLFLMLITLLASACGAPEETAVERVTDAPAEVEAVETESLPTSIAGDDRLSQEYLTGEWCARESSSGSGTTWIFDEDGTTRRGKGEALSEGGDVDTFIASGQIVSVEPDGFVFAQAGAEVRFERGPCSP